MCNCFSYNDGKCACVTLSACQTPCSFYKTREQFLNDREAAAKRLDSLPKEQRESIRDRYYGGGNWR